MRRLVGHSHMVTCCQRYADDDLLFCEGPPPRKGERAWGHLQVEHQCLARERGCNYCATIQGKFSVFAFVFNRDDSRAILKGSEILSLKRALLFLHDFVSVLQPLSVSVDLEEKGSVNRALWKACTFSFSLQIDLLFREPEISSGGVKARCQGPAADQGLGGRQREPGAPGPSGPPEAS
ncbi:unnamed protein product [Arctogadus glacialis]